jgi:hypothetical protein
MLAYTSKNLRNININTPVLGCFFYGEKTFACFRIFKIKLNLSENPDQVTDLMVPIR